MGIQLAALPSRRRACLSLNCLQTVILCAFCVTKFPPKPVFPEGLPRTPLSSSRGAAADPHGVVIRGSFLWFYRELDFFWWKSGMGSICMLRDWHVSHLKPLQSSTSIAQAAFFHHTDALGRTERKNNVIWSPRKTYAYVKFCHVSGFLLMGRDILLVLSATNLTLIQIVDLPSCRDLSGSLWRSMPTVRNLLSSPVSKYWFGVEYLPNLLSFSHALSSQQCCLSK